MWPKQKEASQGPALPANKNAWTQGASRSWCGKGQSAEVFPTEVIVAFLKKILFKEDHLKILHLDI